MKFKKQYKILSAAASEEYRYMTSGVKFEKDPGRLIATNGRIMVVVPVEDTDGDVDGIISPDAMKLAGKGGKKGETTIASLDSVARVFLKEGTADFPHLEANFPDWEVVQPKASTTDLNITLSGAYLKDIVDALGTAGDDLDGVKFQFKLKKGQIDDNAPVRVEAASPLNGAYGCIMPICRGK